MSLVIAQTREDTFKRALASFASGVTVISFRDSRGRPCGMTASAFSSVSLEPFLVLVCLNRSARTYDDVTARGRFGVNILDRSATDISDYCARLGQDKRLPDDWLYPDDDLERPPVLSSSLAYLDCSVASEFPAGTHSIVVGEVGAVGLADDAEGMPLVYFQGTYRELKVTEVAEVWR